MENLGNCEKCHAPNALSKAGKVYCSAKCWLPPEQVNTPPQQQQAKPYIRPKELFNVTSTVPNFGNDTSKHDIVVSRVEKPHSYEFGKAGARHKIYYNKVDELRVQIAALKDAGLVEPDLETPAY